uniref:Uncharacterized protein n=1 Tax=Triticum urartu TaxID=4572 RepID=A0A8R7QV79_TRIUA
MLNLKRCMWLILLCSLVKLVFSLSIVLG